MNPRQKNYSRYLKQLCVFAMFGVIMFISKKIMEFLPNFHLLGMFIVSLTAVYKKKALIPIYVYVMLDGLFGGFSLWWYPYLYVWTVLWGMTMLVPKKVPQKILAFIYPVISALHGLFFGTLYAPFHAIVYGFGFDQMLEWILIGFTFDIMHFVGNLVVGIMIIPCINVLKKLEKTY